jgi:hypothetical protein
MAWIDAHPEVAGTALGGRVLANLNLDMVGEHLELLHSSLTLTRTPASLPSAVNDVVANMAELVDRTDIRTPRGSLSRMNWRVTPYSGGSDHMMFIERRIPGVMFTHDPDYTHHTSEDTPDKVDPVELERSELIAAATMLYLADLTAAEAVDLVGLVAGNGAARLAAAARAATRRMLAAEAPERGDAWIEAANALRHAARGERDAVRSVLTFNGAAAVRDAAERAERRLAAQEAALLDELRAAARGGGLPTADRPRAADLRVPVRLTRGPLDFGLPESRLPPDRAAWYAGDMPFGGDARFELVNFIDGRRSVSEIRDALAAEFGPVTLDAVRRYLEDLVTVEVVRWR